MKVLVTGGAGFIGSHVVDRLIAEGAKAVVVDNLSGHAANRHVHPSVVYYKVDITDAALSDVFEKEKPEYVCHLAAQVDVRKSLADPLNDAKVNVLGTIRLLECARMHRVRKIVYSSSAAVYGAPEYLSVDEQHVVRPQSFYGISKHMPEQYLRCYADLYGLDYTILRYANVYGARQDTKGEAGVVAIFLEKMLRGTSPVIYGDGEQTRDFVYVTDVADANALALSRGHGETINIGCNRQTSVNNLYQMLSRLLALNIPPIRENTRPADIVHSYLDNSKAERLLGWRPNFDLEQGLRETIAYYVQKETAYSSPA